MSVPAFILFISIAVSVAGNSFPLAVQQAFFGLFGDTAQTYHVDALTGRDTAKGSHGAPWATLQHAADQAEPGDTILVRAGTYAPFEIRKSGTQDSPITFTAATEARHRVVVDGTGSSVRGLIMARGQSHLEIRGFRIVNAPVDGVFFEGSEQGAYGIRIIDNVVDTTGNAGIYVCGLIMGQSIGVDEYRMFDVLIEGNEVTNTNYPDGGNEAISLGGGVDGFIIRDNWVHDSEQYGIDAKFGAINGEITGNLIHGIEKHGIYLDANSRRVAHILVADNTIFDSNNGIALARESARPPILPNLHDITIRANHVRDNTRFGILAYRHKNDPGTGRFDSILIEDNIVERNGETGIRITGLAGIAADIRIEGNQMTDNGRDFVNDLLRPGSESSGNK